VNSIPSGPSLDKVTVLLNGTKAPSVIVAANAGNVAKLDTLDLTHGHGAAIAPTDMVTVDYCGVGMVSHNVFDSSWARGQQASFALNQVISGWTEGLTGMKVGGTRLLVIPGSLAYGANPPTSAIGPNETLIFVVTAAAANPAGSAG